MIKKKILSTGISLLLSSLLIAPAVLAQVQPIGNLGVEYGSYTGLGGRDVRQTVAQIINVALGLLGIVAVVIILVGGFEWMTAGGNEEKTGEAKARITAGIIGLAIILSAYAIATFVIRSLTQATAP